MSVERDAAAAQALLHAIVGDGADAIFVKDRELRYTLCKRDQRAVGRTPLRGHRRQDRPRPLLRRIGRYPGRAGPARDRDRGDRDRRGASDAQRPVARLRHDEVPAPRCRWDDRRLGRRGARHHPPRPNDRTPASRRDLPAARPRCDAGRRRGDRCAGRHRARQRCREANLGRIHRSWQRAVAAQSRLVPRHRRARAAARVGLGPRAVRRRPSARSGHRHRVDGRYAPNDPELGGADRAADGFSRSGHRQRGRDRARASRRGPGARAEDRGHRTARRERRARLQQPAHHHHELRRQRR
jgi:hypothetical protein